MSSYDIKKRKLKEQAIESSKRKKLKQGDEA